MNKYQQVLQLFTGYDPIRTWMESPFTQSGYVYATNAHIAIQISGKKIEQMCYEELEKPDSSVIFRKEKTMDEVITLERLTEVYKSIPLTKKDRCPACYGTGKVDFEFEFEDAVYTNRNECPICRGEGVVESDFEKPDSRYMISLLEHYNPIQPKYIHKLISAMGILETLSVRLVACDGYIYIFEVEEGVKIAISSSIVDFDMKEYVLKY